MLPRRWSAMPPQLPTLSRASRYHRVELSRRIVILIEEEVLGVVDGLIRAVLLSCSGVSTPSIAAFFAFLPVPTSSWAEEHLHGRTGSS